MLLNLTISLLIPMLKWFLSKKSKKTLNAEEFAALVLEHSTQRKGAGQTALDWKTSLSKLKESIAKKKE